MRNEAAEKRRSAVVALSRDVQVVMDVGRDVGAIVFPLFSALCLASRWWMGGCECGMLRLLVLLLLLLLLLLLWLLLLLLLLKCLVEKREKVK